MKDELPKEIQDKIDNALSIAVKKCEDNGVEILSARESQWRTCMEEGADIALNYTADTVAKVSQMMGSQRKEIEDLKAELARRTMFLQSLVSTSQLRDIISYEPKP